MICEARPKWPWHVLLSFLRWKLTDKKLSHRHLKWCKWNLPAVYRCFMGCEISHYAVHLYFPVSRTVFSGESFSIYLRISIVIVVMWQMIHRQIPTMTHQRPQNMTRLGIVQKVFCLLRSENDRNHFQSVINKDNNCFEEFVQNICKWSTMAFSGTWEMKYNEFFVWWTVDARRWLLSPQVLYASVALLVTVNQLWALESSLLQEMFTCCLIRTKCTPWEKTHLWL